MKLPNNEQLNKKPKNTGKGYKYFYFLLFVLTKKNNFKITFSNRSAGIKRNKKILSHGEKVNLYPNFKHKRQTYTPYKMF